MKSLGMILDPCWCKVDVNDVHVDVQINIHVVHVDAHHDYYDGGVDHEDFRFLIQRITEIW